MGTRPRFRWSAPCPRAQVRAGVRLDAGQQAAHGWFAAPRVPRRVHPRPTTRQDSGGGPPPQHHDQLSPFVDATPPFGAGSQRLRQNGGVRHETAVRRLRAIAARCQRVSGLYEDDPFLIAAYTFGAVLDAPADLPAVQTAFVLSLPAEELTWCAQPQSCVGLPQLLEIEKAPVEWWLRPSVWPVANHAIRRPLRVWSLDGGPDLAALDALAHGEADALRVPDPPPAHLRAQLAAELAASRTHL